MVDTGEIEVLPESVKALLGSLEGERQQVGHGDEALPARHRDLHELVLDRAHLAVGPSVASTSPARRPGIVPNEIHR